MSLRSFVLAVLLLSTVAKAQQSTGPADPIEKFPKIVAIVEGKTISREQLADECIKRYGSVVLDNLLNKQLILQACKAKNVNITQDDVNKEIARVANKVGLDTPRFLEAIQRERDITPEQYASEITWPMLALRALAADQIEVKPGEVEQIIQSEYGPKVQVRMIAVSKKETAEELYKAAAAAPETFRRLAKEKSEDAASASVDGLLPPIRQNNNPNDPLERVAFQLQPNEISAPFAMGNLHVLLQCVRHLPATPPSPNLMPEIRNRIAEQLRDQRLGAAADGIFAGLKENAQVVTVMGNAEYEKKYPGVAAYINRQPLPYTYLAAECMTRHGKEILRGEISRLLLTLQLQKQKKTVEQADIDREVARAADAAGYFRDGQPDVAGWLKSIQKEEGVSVQLYVSDAVWPSVALEKLVEDKVTITDEDLQKGYENNFGPRAEVLACVCSSQRAAEDVFREARGAGEQKFGELAAKYSVEQISRSNFGKIPAIRRHSGNPNLEEAAFALEPGKVSGILVWGDQYAVLYKQGETKPVVQDFEAVRGELTNEIRTKKLYVAMRKYMNDLLANSNIENFIEAKVSGNQVVPASATGGNGSVIVPR